MHMITKSFLLALLVTSFFALFVGCGDSPNDVVFIEPINTPTNTQTPPKATATEGLECKELLDEVVLDLNSQISYLSRAVANTQSLLDTCENTVFAQSIVVKENRYLKNRIDKLVVYIDRLIKETADLKGQRRECQ